MTKIFDRLKNSASRMLRNESGNFVLTFAVCLLPIMYSAGVAFDYTIAKNVRTNMQQALDAASLAAAVGDDLTVEERIQIAKDNFDALFDEPGIDITPTFTIENQVITAVASYDNPTYFTGLMGKPTLGLSVGTEIKYSVESAAEVALVLDYSSSMNSNNKWQTMRDAAKDLVDVLGENGTKDDIKFALAPFSRIVHATLPSEYVVGLDAGSTWTGCTQDRMFPNNISDVTPNYYDDETKWGLTPSANSNHCDGQIDKKLTVRPLTTNHGQIKNWLNEMSPNRGTHIALGMSFGWHLVSPNPPFSGGVDYDDESTKKFIVLLTDGQQTVKAWGPSETYKTSNGEANLEDMCTLVKNKGVYVVTIAFDLSDGSTKDRLRDCATNYAYFFDAESNDELSTAFQTVAALIQGSLHISK